MDKKELEARTKHFAIMTIRFVNGFRVSPAERVIANQLLRSGTSIGANYREANRAVSRRDFAHRIAITEKETSETLYWLEICAGTKIGDAEERKKLLAEADELLAIFTAIGRSIRKTARAERRVQRGRVSQSDEPGYASDQIETEVSSLLPVDVTGDAPSGSDRDL